MSGSAPARPGILTRLVAAARFAVTGTGPANWFGPAEPIAPQAPPQVAGRQLDYTPAVNLNYSPRHDEDITAEQLRALAENCDVVRIIIQTRKDQLAAQKWQFQLKDKTARKRPDPRIDQLNAFFTSPDREHSWDEWIGAILDDLLVIDAATVYPRRTLGGAIYAFEFIDGATIKRVIDDWGRTPLPPEPAYQQILHGLPAVNYTRDELLYAPRNLRSYKLYGMSPVQQIAMTVNIALRRQMSQLEYYTSGTVPDALAGVPDTWSPEQIGEYQRYWDELLTDDTAARRKVRFVPGAAAKAFVQTKEAMLTDAFDEWLARVASYAFSVSPQWAVKQVNRATAETAEGMANAEGLQPLLKWVASLVNRMLMLGWGWSDIEFAWHEEEETDPQAQMTISTGYLKVGALTLNEVRADIGRDPIAGGDDPVIYTPTGIVPLKVALRPPPPPAAPGGDGGAQADEADAEEELLKAADPETRLIAVWSHFLTSEAPRVAAAIVAALPTPVTKAAGDEEVEDDLPAPKKKAHPDAAAAEAAADDLASTLPPSVERVIEQAVAAMPWPAVQASTEAVLATETAAGVVEGLKSGAEVAGLKIPNPLRQADPDAVQAAQDQAAQLVKGVSQTTRDALNRLVTTAESEGWAPKKLAARIVADHAFDDDRAMLIARTELKRAKVTGNIVAWRRQAAMTGLIFKKRIILGQNENHCIACEAAVREGAIPLDEDFSVGFAPPFHPACYCSIVPVVERPVKKGFVCDDGCVEVTKAFNPDQPRRADGKFAATGYDAEREVGRGRAAIANVLATHRDAVDAMTARGLGAVSFVWGKAGHGKAFRQGFGLAHVIARREAEGLDAYSLIHRIPEVLAHGTGAPDGRRGYAFELGGERVVLAQGGSGPEGHWVLTAYVKK